MFSCKSFKSLKTDKSEVILNSLIQAHGGKNYNHTSIEFTFRDSKYEFHIRGSKFDYFKFSKKDGSYIKDMLSNGGFTREVDGKFVELNNKDLNRYSNSLNSVIYFVLLPYKLIDPAVRHSYSGSTVIRGIEYDVLNISFDSYGGGEDFEDEYLFWINKVTDRMDYFAYNYKVNNGGVRFRAAFNPRIINGILFQDYINYKAPVGTKLNDLPVMYEKDQLTRLSEILTEDIRAIN